MSRRKRWENERRGWGSVYRCPGCERDGPEGVQALMLYMASAGIPALRCERCDRVWHLEEVGA